jgi:late competence protein required for DNA uptake (superfamily II DNA/RNA helicase)
MITIGTKRIATHQIKYYDIIKVDEVDAYIYSQPQHIKDKLLSKKAWLISPQ